MQHFTVAPSARREAYDLGRVQVSFPAFFPSYAAPIFRTSANAFVFVATCPPLFNFKVDVLCNC
jgi:hypothetical protein